MSSIHETIQAIRSFMDAGGGVLWAIGGVSCLLWFLVSERFWFLWGTFPNHTAGMIASWRQRRDRTSADAHRLRRMLLCEADLLLRRNLGLIRTLVAICPMLGLLGTVTGMIQVFDVMAVLGTGNARAMASGISRATIPTMAGMVVALPGLYFSALLETRTRRALGRLSDELSLRGTA